MTLPQAQVPLPALRAVARNGLQVKALLINAEGEVLLEQMEGVWQVPGGQVRPGETLEHALARELQVLDLRPSEAFLLTILSGPETLTSGPHGELVYEVTAVYVVREWQDAGARVSTQEFALDRLPPQLSHLDRRALSEVRVCWGMD